MKSLDIKSSLAAWKTLNPRQPWMWPAVPRYLTMVGFIAVVLAGGYFGLIAPEEDALAQSVAKMETLKQEYRDKYQIASNLEGYKKLRAETEVVLAESLRQLPSKSEMESLLTDIHQAAQGRGLQFDLFKPNVSENVFEFYAELPIAIRIEGSYHDLAEFNAALAQLQRIVTLHDMDLSVVPPKATGKSLRDGLAKPTQTMLMTATAKTYRYLDDAEIKEQQKTIAASKRKGKGKGKK